MASESRTRSGRVFQRTSKEKKRKTKHKTHTHKGTTMNTSENNFPILEASINLEPTDLFNTDDESNSNSSKYNSRNQTPDPKRTPRPIKRAKEDTSPNSTTSTLSDQIKPLPPSFYFSTTLGHDINPEKRRSTIVTPRNANENIITKLGEQGQSDPSKKGKQKESYTQETPSSPGPTTQIEQQSSYNFWINFQQIEGETIPQKYQQIRAIFGNIQEFHNGITQRRVPEHFKLAFTSANSMQHALDKAQDLKIETNIISPIDTIEVKTRSILVKEIPLGTTKETIQANFEKFGTINKITWSVIGLWQKATIEYKQKESTDNAIKYWS